MEDMADEFDFSSEEETEIGWIYDESDGFGKYTATHSNDSSFAGKPKRESNVSVVENSSKKKISRMDLNTSKAGMEGLDGEKINQIILDASKGSRFYENERKKEMQVQKRIEELQKKMSLFTAEQKFNARHEMDKIVEELENSRDLSRTIVHVDMDAFYAAVEMRDNPSLKLKPMAVGGSAMLCTSNYLARRYGVRAGMPGFIAKKLCPHLIIVPTNFEKYTKISAEIREIMAYYDPNYLPMSLDEAYLDITDFLKTRQKNRETVLRDFIGQRGQDRQTEEQIGRREELGKRTVVEVDEYEITPGRQSGGVAGDDKVRGNGEIDDDKERYEDEDESNLEVLSNEAEEVVCEMRRKIEEKTQLTASAGIAPNMFLAKVCSDKNKPNGQFYLKPQTKTIMEFVQKLPLRKAFGIGRVSEQILTSVLKIATCSELYDRRDLMHLLFTPTACRSYLEISLGLGSTVIDVNRERKSMSTETTFREINKPEELMSKCYELCQELSKSMEEQGIFARKVGVKLKTVNFEVKTRICSITNAIQEADEIFCYAKKLVSSEIKACHPQPLRLRLMGIRAAELCHTKDTVKESKQLMITNLWQQNGITLSCSQSTTSGRSLQQCDAASTSRGLTSGDAGCLDDTCNDKSKGTSKTAQEVEQCARTHLVCPVCSGNFAFMSDNALVQFNVHVDTCLSKQAIADLLKEEKTLNTNQQPTPKQKQQQTSKKRKRGSPNGMGKRRTLEYFMKK